MITSPFYELGMPAAYGKPSTSGAGGASKTTKVLKDADNATQGLNNTLRRTIFGATRAKTAFSALGGILQAIPTWAKAGVAGLFLFREAFKHGMMVESSKIIMETLTGSMSLASDLITQARKYSVRTLFNPEEVLGATTTAIQRGINPYKRGAYGLRKDQNAMDIFAGLGSMTNPLTGQVLGVNRMTEAILRGDYRLLRPVRGIIDPAYNKAKASGYQVGTPGFNVKFIEELGKIPAIMELAKRQSESIQGLWSTISGLWQEFWMDFTGAQHQEGVVTFWSQIRDIMLDIRANLLPAYEKMQPVIMEFGHAVGSVIKLIYTVGKQLLPALAFGGLLKLAPILLKVGIAVFKMIPIFRILKLVVLSQFLKPFMPLLLQVAGVLNQIGIFINNTLIRAFQFLAKIADSFLKIFFGSSIDKSMKKLSEFITGLQIYIQFWGIYIDAVFDKLEKRIDKFFKSINLTGNPAIRKLINLFLPDKEKISEPVTGVVSPMFKPTAGQGGVTNTINRAFGHEKDLWSREQKIDYLRRAVAARGMSPWDVSDVELNSIVDKMDEKINERGVMAPTTEFVNTLNKLMLEELKKINSKLNEVKPKPSSSKSNLLNTAGEARQ